MPMRTLLAIVLVCAAAATNTRAEGLDRLLIVVPGPDGGGFDRAARAIGTDLERNNLVRRVEYQNVGKAGGLEALPRLASQSADGANVLMVTSAVMLGAAINLRGENLLAATTPIARLATDPLLVAAPCGRPPRNLMALRELIQSGATTLRVAGGPAGSPEHQLARDMFVALNANLASLAYIAHAGGKPAADAVLGGNADIVVTNWSDLASFVEAGRLCGLGTTDITLGGTLKIPSLESVGARAAIGNWRGLLAAQHIDARQRDRFVALAQSLAWSGTWRDTLKHLNWIDSFLPGEAFGRFIVSEGERLSGWITNRQ